MKTEFEFISTVPVMIGGDWGGSAEFFTGKIYFAEITSDILTIV